MQKTIISLCKRNCNSVLKNRNGVVLYNNVARNGLAMYTEVTTLANGKKVSVTEHWPIL